MSAVIVDVDGTLAEFHPHQVSDWVLGSQKQWEPFFAHMAEAPVIEAIAKLVNILKAQGQQIVICSGRPDSHREHTLRWLERHSIPFDAMYLRGRPVARAWVNLPPVRARGFLGQSRLDDRQAGDRDHIISVMIVTLVFSIAS